MSCGGYSGGCGGGSISSISIPIESSCGGSRRLHISHSESGNTTFTIDGNGCGESVSASNDDIVKAFSYMRNNRNL